MAVVKIKSKWAKHKDNLGTMNMFYWKCEDTLKYFETAIAYRVSARFCEIKLLK